MLLSDLALLAALLIQDGGPVGDPGGRFGEHLDERTGLRGPVDALVLDGGALLVVERDADRLVRVGADGAIAPFGPSDLDSPAGVAALEGGFAVADGGNGRVLLLDAKGALTKVLTESPSGSTFRRPAGLAAGADTLFVADPPAGVVHVLALGNGKGGEPRSALAAPLVRPVAVALAPDGAAYVVDSARHRVEVFDASGAHRTGFGDFGPHPAQFGHPSDVAVHEGRVYVADADNHRIQVFSLAGEPLYEWGKHALLPREGAGSLHYPSGIALAPDSSFALVCEAFQDRAQRFGPTERDAALFMTDPSILPWKVAPHYGMELATGGDLLILFEPETQVVLVFDLELEEPVQVTRLGAFGDLPGTFREIADVALDPASWTVYVTDRVRGTLSAFRLDHEPDAPLKNDPRMGSFVRAVDLSAALGAKAGTVAAGALALGPDGALAVVDERAGRVLIFNAALKLEREIAGFDEPVDLVWSGSELGVADRGARSVLLVGADGKERRAFGGFVRPHGLAIEGSGAERVLYVTDEAAHRVRVLDHEGRELRTFGSEGLGQGELYRPRGISIDQAGRLIVLDHGNHRGQVFTREGEFLSAFGPRSYTKPAADPRER